LYTWWYIRSEIYIDCSQVVIRELQPILKELVLNKVFIIILFQVVELGLLAFSMFYFWVVEARRCGHLSFSLISICAK